MKTRYNTIVLEPAASESEQKPSLLKLVGLALSLVAVAAVVAALSVGSARTASITNSEYKALDAVPVNCDAGTKSYMQDLPRWDPNFSTVEDFYNACYYSFRCCTTTGNGNGCYVSDSFGARCRSCLKANGPRFVKKDCVDWINDTELDTSKWTRKDLMDDNGVPPTDNPGYKVMFANYPGAPTEENGMIDTRSCWQPRGAGDKLMVDYAEKCFEVLSWCNLLCPRDTPQTVDHVMCKHCTMFGFDAAYWDIENFRKGMEPPRLD